jgi:hypothetical protein
MCDDYPQLKKVETTMPESSNEKDDAKQASFGSSDRREARDPRLQLERRINRIAGISSFLVYLNLIGALCCFWAWLATWETNAESFFFWTIAWPVCLNGAFVWEVVACILLALGSMSNRAE